MGDEGWFALNSIPASWATAGPTADGQGANINAKSEKGSTSLHYAAKTGHTAVAELLIAKGADINAPDKDGVHFCSYVWNKRP